MLTLPNVFSPQYGFVNRRDRLDMASKVASQTHLLCVRLDEAGHIPFPVCNRRTRLRSKITPEPEWPFSPFDLKCSTQLTFPVCQDQLLAKVTC